MLMEDMFVMTLINSKNKPIWFILISFIFLSSCETLNDLAGLSKAEIDDSLVSETPDLILPPDFDEEPSRTSQSSNVSREDLSLNNFQQPMNYRTVTPKVTNFFSPQINVQSSSTPSDSIEKFKQNKKFTIGEWVYSQYVDGFKRGNLYYRPVYDKGYNFSRRYVPDRNVASFQNNPSTSNQIFQPPNLENEIVKPTFDTLDQLPIIE